MAVFDEVAVSVAPAVAPSTSVRKRVVTHMLYVLCIAPASTVHVVLWFAKLVPFAVRCCSLCSSHRQRRSALWLAVCPAAGSKK